MSLHELADRVAGEPTMIVAGDYGVEDTLGDLVDPNPTTPERALRNSAVARPIGSVSIGELASAYNSGFVSPDSRVNYAMAIAHTRSLGTNA